jgi:hypothetical protein
MASPSPDIAFPAGTGYSSEGYLTDGERLFRVVVAVHPEHGRGFAKLEDCLTLEVRRYGDDELQALELRRVEPASGDG